MYNINKSLTNYLEIHREKQEPKENINEKPKKKKRPKVDIQEAMAEIDASINRVNRIVKRDLEKIAMLDAKIHK